MPICGECGYPVIGKVGDFTNCPYCGLRGNVTIKMPTSTILLLLAGAGLILGTILKRERR